MLNILIIYQVIALVEDAHVVTVDALKNIYPWTSRKQLKWVTINATTLNIANLTNYQLWNKTWPETFLLNLKCLIILLQHLRMISNHLKWTETLNKIIIKINPLFIMSDSLVKVLTRMNSLTGVLILLQFLSLFLLKLLLKNYLSMDILVTRIVTAITRTLLLKLIIKMFNSKKEHKLNLTSHF